MSNSNSASREHPRRHHRFPVEQVFVSLEALNLEGEVLDVSPEGMCVEFSEAHHDLQQGTVWEFTINLHDTETRIPGHIVWRDHPNNTYGVEFSRLTQKQAAYIKQLVVYHTDFGTIQQEDRILEDLE